MATMVLIRHGRTTANATGVLAGRSPGVELDETGRAQAQRAGERLAGVPLAAVVTSPMLRCGQTAEAVLAHQQAPPPVRTEDGVTECDYGDWQGRALKELAGEALWRTVQSQPSAVTFPGGETMAGMQARAVHAVRRLDAQVESEHGPGAVWAVVSHGDIIKSVLADALGLHLDLFQRIGVDPASVSIVRYTEQRPYVLASNTHAGDLSWLAPAPDAPGDAEAAGDAPVGGGAGPEGADREAAAPPGGSGRPTAPLG
ncbi:phosphoglycerate mutase [Nocardioides sp. OK12]|uniref:Putative phosphomutase (TIGR03848 family) n=1 Tax=Nocardioides marinisabuli TaxID=419476 RepID=A0A7Y9JTQ1_9ACTN|nr:MULTISPECIES: histidine phosphatase family protein [Nocardioides]NYD59064.1 putative phosphomutase (TIGR03848 family) [Nocardioides marinisabuli]GHJ60179.1 phosphoglycerate mutase [Nocardioides sp. OK12]